MAIGAGWQAVVAYVNIACYYLFGIPLGLIMGYKLDWGVKVSLALLPYYFRLFHFYYQVKMVKWQLASVIRITLFSSYSSA